MGTSTVGAAEIAAALPAVLAGRSRRAFERLLAPDVRWGGEEDTEQTCHTSGQAGDAYAALLAGGAELTVLHTRVGDHTVLARLEVTGPDDAAESSYQTQVVLTVRDGLVIDILQLDDEEPPVVELLFFTGCPNHEAFLPHLQHLLTGQAVHSPVQLVEVTDDRDAHRLRFLGSPTLRINGRDVEPGADSRNSYGLQCRLYNTPAGPAGTPSDAWILNALHP